ncbi:MAG: hypothetical protein O2960_25860 [Verrucomicrobia bacterium]|nr:hypothetical protein [Verrucomicrobiota bacterium]
MKKQTPLEIQHAEYKQFVIAQLQSIRDAESAERSADRKEHAKKEAAAALLEGGRDWSMA